MLAAMASDGALRIYTDGACSGNPGPGGWAWASSRDHSGSGGDPDTTNNKMELTAVLEAMRSNPGEIVVVMDSTYVKDGLEKWSVNWIRNGWMTKDRKPVKNKEIWVPLLEEKDRRGSEVRFEWVKGHSGDVMNDLVDELAVIQRDAFRTAIGGTIAGSPGGGGKISDLAVDEQRAERRRRDGRIPPGHLVLVLGLPPGELGGWERNAMSDDVRRRLRQWIEAQAVLHSDLVVLTGLRPGSELLAAEAAIEAELPYAAAIGFPGIDRNLSTASRARFAELTARARHIIQVEKKSPVDTAAFVKAMERRDTWLINAADQAVLVWDQADARLARTFAALDKRFGPDLFVIGPDPSLP